MQFHLKLFPLGQNKTLGHTAIIPTLDFSLSGSDYYYLVKL